MYILQGGTRTCSNMEGVHVALWNMYMFHFRCQVLSRLIDRYRRAYYIGIAKLMTYLLSNGCCI